MPTALYLSRAQSAILAAAAASVCWAARVPGEVAHYSFRHRECTKTFKFTDSVHAGTDDMSLARRLSKGTGLSCMDGHLGVRLNYTVDPTVIPACLSPSPPPSAAAIPDDDYLPAQSTHSSGTGFFNSGLEDGFTIELWMRPEPQLDTTRLILSLATACPDLSVGPDDDDKLCEDGKATSSSSGGTSMSFRLLQTENGCISVQFKRDLRDCVLAPEWSDTFCDTTAGRVVDPSQDYQQVVVAVSNAIGTGSASSPGRLRIYIDGVMTLDSEPASPSLNLGSTVLNNQVGSFNTGDVNFTDLFSPSHVLSLGADGYGGPDTSGVHPWAGDIFMLSMYGRPLTQAEVQTNLAQGLDNSDPQASNATFNTTEDSCVALPSLAGHITDWDVTGLPARSQPLSARLTSLPACASGGGSGCGDFYSDSSCTNRITAASALADLEPDAVYYQGAPNAYSYAEDGSTVGVQGSEGVYALVEWEASDNNTGTDTATLHIRVASVNDAPIAWDYTTPTVAGANPSPVYMDLPYSIYVNGTDVDGADPADPIAECSIEITSLPSHGTLRAEQSDGTPYGADLVVGSVVPANHLSYRSVYFEDTAGDRIVATDSFGFKLVDAFGEESVGSGTVTIPIMSGLDSIWRCESSFNDNCYTAPPTVNEEEMTAIELSGINQRGGETWFVITELPSHGLLYFYPPGGEPGVNITTAPMNVSGSSVYDCPGNPGFRCAQVGYKGDVDYFSFPHYTRDGAFLNNSDDVFKFTVNSGKGVSAEAQVQVIINNVNDRVEIIYPSNVTYITSPAAGDPPDKVLTNVVLHDRDRGVGYYQISVSVNLGSLSETTHKQAILGGNLIAEPDKWQWSLDALNAYLGYCPTPCMTTGACQGYLCLGGVPGDSHNVQELKVFATPATAQRFLKDLLYKGNANAGNRVLRIYIDDFDDGVHSPPPAPPPGTPPPLPRSAAIKLLPVVECNTFLGTTCGDDDGQRCGGGITTTAVGGLIFATICIAWLVACCRQRTRTSVRDRRGRRKRKRDQATSDMRCFVPLFATAMLMSVLGCFNLRSGGQMHALRTMDFWGDGYCGPNATDYNFEEERPDYEARFNNTQYANLSFDGATNIGYDNLGCTGGVPAGFMYRRMLGDIFVLNAVGSLAIIEASGRERGRCLTGSISFLIFFLVVVKFGVWEQWLDQIEEGPACSDLDVCPSFITPIPEDKRVEGGPEYALGTCDGRDLRPFQNNMVVAILPLMVAGTLGIIGVLVLCCMCDRMRGKSDDDDDDDYSDSDSDSEDDRRRRRKHKGKGGRHERDRHHGKKKGRHHDRDSEDSDDDDRGKKHGKTGKKDKKGKDKKEKYRSSEDEDDEPRPPKHKPSRHAEDVRAPQVPGTGKLKMKPGPPKKGGEAGQTMVSISMANFGAAPPAPGASCYAAQPPPPAAYAPPPPVEWFYMDANEVQQGPTTEQGLQQLYNMGDIHDFTYVWNENLPNWAPYRDMNFGAGGGAYPTGLNTTYC